MSSSPNTPKPGMTQRPDSPAPMRRLGPRPLALHLMLSGMDWSNSASTSTPFDTATAADPKPPPAPDTEFIAGVAAYRRHPYRRTLSDPPAIWTEGETRLLDYGGAEPTVLVVPSLINRAYVLDLAPGRSMVRHLASAGVRSVLRDWGWLGTAERPFTLADYVLRLERALAALDRPVVLLGYCMGGLLALAAALRNPRVVHALALLATPWNFHAGLPRFASAAATLAQQAAALPPGTPVCIDAMQTLFALADPAGVFAKYREFTTLDPAGERARMFVAFEDWLADGVPLAARVAQECFGGWYAQNLPGLGRWAVSGTLIDPAALQLPTLVALPARDRIVPPESAVPLTHLIGGARVLHPAAGHVGMVAGGRAREQLWDPLLDWLRAL